MILCIAMDSMDHGAIRVRFGPSTTNTSLILFMALRLGGYQVVTWLLVMSALQWLEVIRGCIYYFKMLGVHMWKLQPGNLGFKLNGIHFFLCFSHFEGHAAQMIQMAVETGINSTPLDHLDHLTTKREGKT